RVVRRSPSAWAQQDCARCAVRGRRGSGLVHHGFVLVTVRRGRAASARSTATGLAGNVVGVERKPIRAWLPSQNGFVALAPQGQSPVCCTQAIARPVPLVISRLPRIWSGPSSCGSISSTPLRTSSIASLSVGGSPVAANATAWCDPSQYGLFRD